MFRGDVEIRYISMIKDSCKASAKWEKVNAFYKCIFECNMHQIVQCNMCRWVVYLCNWQNIATVCVCVWRGGQQKCHTMFGAALGAHTLKSGHDMCRFHCVLLQKSAHRTREGETVSWQTFSNNTPCAASEIFLWIQAMSLVWSRHMHPWPDRGRVHAGRSVPEQQETERLASAKISTTLTQNYHLHTARHTHSLSSK